MSVSVVRSRRLDPVLDFGSGFGSGLTGGVTPPGRVDPRGWGMSSPGAELDVAWSFGPFPDD
jgi:hypothetical protein